MPATEFTRNVWHILLYCSVLFLDVVLSSVNEVYLQKYGCAKSGTLRAGIALLSVKSDVQCAVLCMDNCVAMVTKGQIAGSRECGLFQYTTDIPAHSMTTCLDDGSLAIFYKISAQQPALRCDATMTVYGQTHCLQNTNVYTRSYSTAKSTCEALGGQLPVAETHDHLDVIKSLFDTAVYIWMAATDTVTQGVYLWPDGNAMDANLWDPEEPSHSFERCTGILKDRTRLMYDLSCEGFIEASYTVCAIIMY